MLFVCNAMISVFAVLSLVAGVRALTCSIDATSRAASFGKAPFVNHSRTAPNLRVQLLEDTHGALHLCLFARRDIEPNEELLFDYGERRRAVIEDLPWLKK